MGARARRPGGNRIEGAISAKSVRASERPHVSIRPGIDTIPLRTDECSAMYVPTSDTTSGICATVRKGTKESMASERAKASDLKTAAYAAADKVATGVFTTTTPDYVEGINVGRVTRYVRTEDMGDAPIPTTRLRVLGEQSSNRSQGKGWRKSGSTRKPRLRIEEDNAIRNYLATLGFKGEVTPFIRERALDAMEHRASWEG